MFARILTGCKAVSFFAVLFYICSSTVICAQQASRNPYIPGEILVRFKQGVVDLPQGVTEIGIANASIKLEVKTILENVRVNTVEKVFKNFMPADTISVSRIGEPIKVVNLSQIYKLTVPVTTDIPKIVDQLQSLKDVVYAEPNYIVKASATPNDEYYSLQWALEQTNDADIDATTAWEHNTGSSSIKIGIVDSGIDYNHDDFDATGKIIQGYNYVHGNNDPMDDNWVSHGTHVAGIAGALTNNESEGIAGVAGGWDGSNIGNKLIAVKVFDQEGTGEIPWVANGIVNAVNLGADVVNFSGGTYGATNTLRAAVNYAYRHGVVMAVAMGNEDNDRPHYPAATYDGNWVIAVGATKQNDYRCNNDDWPGYDQYGYPKGSGYGPWIDVVAPGHQIFSTLRTIYTVPYGYLSGTSMATPHGGGLAGLILSENPNLVPEDVEGIMRASADDMVGRPIEDVPGFDQYMGYGRINAGRTLEWMNADLSNVHLSHFVDPGGGYVYHSTDLFVLTVYYHGDYVGTYYAKRHEVRKEKSYYYSYGDTTYVWGVGYGTGGGDNTTIGWSPSNPNYQEPWCEVIPGSQDRNGFTLRSYVYQLWSIAGYPYYGYFPTTPSGVKYAWSELRIDYAPSIPQGLTLSTSPSGSAYLTWDPNPEPDIDHYEVWRKYWWSKYNYTSWSKIGETSNAFYEDEEFSPDPNGGTKAYYKIRAVDEMDQYSGFSSTVSSWGTPGEQKIGSLSQTPTEFCLFPNCPNPFNPETEIEFALPEASWVTLTVYNILGQVVEVLVDSEQQAGYHKVQWNGERVASGVYFYRLTAGEFTDTKRMVLMK